MPSASPIQPSFNGGELSPLVAGRFDTAKVAIGCERLENFFPAIQGPAVACGGSRFVAEVKTSANRTWLVPFEFGADDAYMLEFGHQYIRFMANRGVVVSGMTPYEIASPYSASELTASDGSCALRWVQTGDVVYLFHLMHPVYKLQRFGPTSWTCTPVDFLPPPFKDENTTATSIYASAATGAGVTLTASASVFSAAMVGQYIRLAEKSVRDTPLWEAGKSVTAGALRRSDGKNYQAVNSATTGGGKPTHTSGAVFDGDGGVQWQFLDYGEGWAKITAYSSDTSVTANVVQRLPDGAVGAPHATTRWALEAWNDTDGYPTCGTFFRERLTLARGSQIWFSVAGDFENFSTTVEGQITADAGFDRRIASDRENSIRWMSPGNVLLLGTAGDEWAIVEGTTTDPFGPENCRTKPQSSYGSANVAPVRVGNETMFVQKSGRKTRAMAFRFEEDGFLSPDITVYAEHITKPRLVDMAYQQELHSVLWGLRSDGVLAGCTFSREQEAAGWFRRTFAGGVCESVRCIPSPDGGRDDVWVIVRYTVDGQTKRYIAFLESEAEADTPQEDWLYVDMGLTYSGAPATTISGLDHLEGKEVWVLRDGARHPNATVVGGEITLQAEGSTVQVGLPLPAYAIPMQLNAGAAQGTAQGKTKRVHKVVFRVHNTLGAVAGSSVDRLNELRFRTPNVPMGQAPLPFTGDVAIDWDGDFDTKQTVAFARDKPMPATLVAIMPELKTEG